MFWLWFSVLKGGIISLPMLWKWYILLVTCAFMICLICIPPALGPAVLGLRVYISGKSLMPMLQLLQILFDYQLHHTSLSIVDHCKYLGITIQLDLKWSIHVYNISAKANRTLSLLRRNLKIANQSFREIAYFTFVRPQLE